MTRWFIDQWLELFSTRYEAFRMKHFYRRRPSRSTPDCSVRHGTRIASADSSGPRGHSWICLRSLPDAGGRVTVLDLERELEADKIHLDDGHFTDAIHIAPSLHRIIARKILDQILRTGVLGLSGPAVGPNGR